MSESPNPFGLPDDVWANLDHADSAQRRAPLGSRPIGVASDGCDAICCTPPLSFRAVFGPADEWYGLRRVWRELRVNNCCDARIWLGKPFCAPITRVELLERSA